MYLLKNQSFPFSLSNTNINYGSKIFFKMKIYEIYEIYGKIIRTIIIP